MADSVEADSSKPMLAQDTAELPAGDAHTKEQEAGPQPAAKLDPQPSAAPAAELLEGEQPDAAAAPTPAEGATPPPSMTGDVTPKTPATAGRGTGKKGRGAARAGQKGSSRGRGSAKRGKQEHPDTDPEDDGGNADGGLQTRRSSRQSKKPKTFAQEFIAEPDLDSLGGDSAEAAEATDVKMQQEAEPAAKPERSQDSDEMPLVKAVQTGPTDAEAAAEAAQADQPQEAKTYARKKKVQETAQEDAPDQAPEKGEADAEEAKSPRARRGNSQEAGQVGSAAEAPEAEHPAHLGDHKSPKAKRKRPSDANQVGGQGDASDLAAGTEGKQAAQKRRRCRTLPALGKAGKETPAGDRRRNKSREASLEIPVEVEAAPDQATRQRAAAGAAGQQAAPAKTRPVSELEHIRAGLQKAEEAHERKLGELRHLDAQVKGYMEHLSRMDLTVNQLSRTGIGKTVRRFNRWPTQREHSVKSSQESASDPAKALVLKWHSVAGVSHPRLAKPAAAAVPARTGEAKEKQVAQPEQEAPKEKAPAQAAWPLPAQAAQQPAQAVPHPVSEATQATPGAAAAPVKKEEPKVVSIGFKQELPTPVRKLQPSRADASHSTGSNVRDKALGILLHALTPDKALSREESAKKLEAALYATCANGKAAGRPGQPAEPGVTYMRRLRVLWSWLDGSSPCRSPGLKRLFMEGKLAASDLATMDARRVRDLTEPPASSATPHPGSQQDANGALTGVAPGAAEAPFRGEGPQHSMDMDIDPPSQGPAVPGLPGHGIAVSALPSQELLAKLQLFCEGSLQPPQPSSSHLQGFTEPPLEQTVREIVQHQEAALRACQAGQASAEQLHGVIAAGRLLERSLGTGGQPAAAPQQTQPLLLPEEAQLQLLPFTQAALSALSRPSAAPGQPAVAPGSATLRTVLPPQAAATVHATADQALHASAPSLTTAQPVSHSSAPGQSQEGPVPNGDTGGLREDPAPDLAVALPTSPPRTPVLGETAHNGPAPLAASANPDSSAAGDDHFANMRLAPSERQGWRSEERPIPSALFSHPAKHMHDGAAGLLHAQHRGGAGGSAEQPAGNGAMSAPVNAEQQGKA